MTGYQHGGDIYTRNIAYDFSVNVNPLGLPERVAAAVTESVGETSSYPDSESRALRRALSEHHHVEMERIICGNGAADLIFQLVLAKKPKKAMVMAPSFSEYEQALNLVDCRISYCNLSVRDFFAFSAKEFIHCMDSQLDMVFICNPNNPTGHAVKKEELKEILNLCRKWEILAVVDECFCDFLVNAKEYSVLEYLEEFPQLFVLKAFTKTYAMAGIRLGYGLCSQISLLNRMRSVRQPWSVSTIAQKAGIAALSEQAYLEQAVKLISRERKYLEQVLTELGFAVYPSKVNYILFQDNRITKTHQKTCEHESLYEQCQNRQILIRSCANYRGLDDRFYRICVKKRKENEHLANVLKEILNDCFIST